jgi:hypothetical protein
LHASTSLERIRFNCNVISGSLGLAFGVGKTGPKM